MREFLRESAGVKGSGLLGAVKSFKELKIHLPVKNTLTKCGVPWCRPHIVMERYEITSVRFATGDYGTTVPGLVIISSNAIVQLALYLPEKRGRLDEVLELMDLEFIPFEFA